jgi:hypothetical protein
VYNGERNQPEKNTMTIKITKSRMKEILENPYAVETADIRAALRGAGFTNRQVNVRESKKGPWYIVHVKDANIKNEVVYNVLRPIGGGLSIDIYYTDGTQGTVTRRPAGIGAG